MSLISTAWAQDAANAGSLGVVMQLAPLLLIFGVFYFLLIRPQQKRQRELKTMLAAVKRGDEIYFGGGIRGRLTTVKEGSDEVEVEIAPSVRLRLLRSGISDVVRPIPANDAKPSTETAKVVSRE